MVDFFFLKKGSSVFNLTIPMCVRDGKNLLSIQHVFTKCLLWAKHYTSDWDIMSKQVWTLISWSLQSHGGDRHYSNKHQDVYFTRQTLTQLLL